MSVDFQIVDTDYREKTNYLSKQNLIAGWAR